MRFTTDSAIAANCRNSSRLIEQAASCLARIVNSGSCACRQNEHQIISGEAARDEVLRIERRYSRHRDESELSRINRHAASGHEVAVDREAAGLLNFAFEGYEKSGELFDISSGILRKAWNFAANHRMFNVCLSARLFGYVDRNQISFAMALLMSKFCGEV